MTPDLLAAIIRLFLPFILIICFFVWVSKDLNNDRQ